MLKYGDKIGLVCCSNGLMETDRERVLLLKERLKSMGITAVESPFLYGRESVFGGSGYERACALMSFYEDESIKAIHDISGGDIANEILEFLDFGKIKAADKPLFGYSDLTTVLNAIYTKTGQIAGLYQLLNLAGSRGEQQTEAFEDTFLKDGNALTQFSYRFLRGSQMEGIVLGGNVRCFLKLAGTPYWPDLTGKILFLESNGGEAAQMVTYASQLKQMGVFEKINGLLLGCFTVMEKRKCRPPVETIFLTAAGGKLPVAKTDEIGHGSGSKCLMLGGRQNNIYG